MFITSYCAVCAGKRMASTKKLVAREKMRRLEWQNACQQEKQLYFEAKKQMQVMESENAQLQKKYKQSLLEQTRLRKDHDRDVSMLNGHLMQLKCKLDQYMNVQDPRAEISALEDDPDASRDLRREREQIRREMQHFSFFPSGHADSQSPPSRVLQAPASSSSSSSRSRPLSSSKRGNGKISSPSFSPSSSAYQAEQRLVDAEQRLFDAVSSNNVDASDESADEREQEQLQRDSMRVAVVDTEGLDSQEEFERLFQDIPPEIRKVSDGLVQQAAGQDAKKKKEKASAKKKTGAGDKKRNRKARKPVSTATSATNITRAIDRLTTAASSSTKKSARGGSKTTQLSSATAAKSIEKKAAVSTSTRSSKSSSSSSRGKGVASKKKIESQTTTAAAAVPKAKAKSKSISPSPAQHKDPVLIKRPSSARAPTIPTEEQGNEQLASPQKSVYEQYVNSGVSKYSPLRNNKWHMSSRDQQPEPLRRDESALSPTKKRSVFEQYLERSEADRQHMRL
jgi:hypothetical protein